jgi:protein phosphatase methylesterase 1
LVTAHLTLAISCGVIAFDVRHHGSTTFDESADWNLSLQALALDEVEVVQGVAKYASWDTREDGWPDLILVGHRYVHLPKASNRSLGGAVSAHVAANNLLPILCLTVIDVVEGSAMDALQSMQTYLNTRPQTFRSVEQAVRWHMSSRTIRNRESARISVPALLVECQGEWKWRTDLGKTRPFWEGSSFDGGG